jgi:hypothetical protein
VFHFVKDVESGEASTNLLIEGLSMDANFDLALS